MTEEQRKRKAEKDHEWYLKNKEKVKARAIAWYKAHPEKAREKSRRRYYKHHESEKARRIQYRLDHIEHEKAYFKERSKRLYKENRVNILAYFKEHPCIDCGETDPDVLEFDHVRGEKKFNISNRIRIRNWDVILLETKKCEVRCANCHKRRHARLRKSTRP